MALLFALCSTVVLYMPVLCSNVEKRTKKLVTKVDGSTIFFYVLAMEMFFNLAGGYKQVNLKQQ